MYCLFRRSFGGTTDDAPVSGNAEGVTKWREAMAESQFQSLLEEEAIEQIVDTVQQAETGEAPFALVLGAGFSHGLVPTARELVEESLPLWVESFATNRSSSCVWALPSSAPALPVRSGSNSLNGMQAGDCPWMDTL